MEVIKKNKNPVRTAKRSFFALGLLYMIISAFFAFFYTVSPETVIVAPIVGVLVLIAAYLLSKKKMAGVYLGWVSLIIGTLTIPMYPPIMVFIIFAYVGYWNYKASVAIKNKNTI